MIRKTNKTKNPTSIGVWSSPLVGWIKLNFDAFFADKETHAACTYLNRHSRLMTYAVAQTLKLARELKTTKIVVEGDVQEVILALPGHSQAED